MPDKTLDIFDREAHNPSIHSLIADTCGSEDPHVIVDYCVPCNPYFPTEEMFTEIEASLRRLLRHYPSDRNLIEKRLAGFVGLPAEGLVLGNGSTELISILNQRIAHAPIATPIPTFGRWTDEPPTLGKTVKMFQMSEQDDFRFSASDFVQFCQNVKARTAVLCNPNNPTGFAFGGEELERMIQDLSDLELIVIDESFAEFHKGKAVIDVQAIVARHRNVVFLRSLGKNLGLHGIRMGYAYMAPPMAEQVRCFLPYWNINAVAEAIIEMLPRHREAYEGSLVLCARDRDYLATRLQEVPMLKSYSSAANFILCRLDDRIHGVTLRDQLLYRHGFFVRECGNKVGSSSQFLRIAVRPKADSDGIVDALKQLLQKM